MQHKISRYDDYSNSNAMLKLCYPGHTLNYYRSKDHTKSLLNNLKLLLINDLSPNITKENRKFSLYQLKSPKSTQGSKYSNSSFSVQNRHNLMRKINQINVLKKDSRILNSSIYKQTWKDKGNSKRTNLSYTSSGFHDTNYINMINQCKIETIIKKSNIFDPSLNKPLDGLKTNSNYELLNLKKLEIFNNFYQNINKKNDKETFRIESTQIHNKLDNLVEK